MYYGYMLRCMYNSIYKCINTNIERRMQEHFSKDKKCAKYTIRHTAKKLECVWKTEDRVLASKLEYYIKTLSKSKKETLLLEHNLALVLKDKIEADKYILQKDIKI